MKEALISVLAWLVISIATSFIAYRQGFFKLDKKPYTNNIDFLDLFVALLIFLSTQLVIAPLALYGFYKLFYGIDLFSNSEIVKNEAQGLLIIYKDLFLLVLFGGYYLFLGSRVKGMFGKGRDLRNIGLGIATWFIAVPIASLVSNSIELGLRFLRQKPEEQTVVHYLKETMVRPELFLTLAFFIIVITPILEELLFRGFLQSWLRSVLGLKWAIAITSILFSLFHFSSEQSWDNLIILSVLFVLSCFLGYIYERQRSLFAPIGLHATFNAVTVMMIFFNHS